MLDSAARPRGIIEPVSAESFADVLRGSGQNAEDPVVGWLYPRAEALALFAATLGPEVTSAVDELFALGEAPLAVSLDAAASRMADNATTALAATFTSHVVGQGAPAEDLHVLGYSPGYCGWHVSGQHALFGRLHPETIGITLGDSALMHPLKSVSGVLIAGSAATHTFETGFTYCSSCKDRSCVARMSSLGPTANLGPPAERN
jgi:cobalamin-dependent methionine synthase I